MAILASHRVAEWAWGSLAELGRAVHSHGGWKVAISASHRCVWLPVTEDFQVAGPQCVLGREQVLALIMT